MTPRSIAVMLFAATVVLLLCTPEGLAHGTHGPVSVTDGTAYTPPPGAGWWETIYGHIVHNMGSMLRLARNGDELGPFVTIMVLAFGYGILHAVGPGHGKLLLASYMTATHAPASLGIAMAFAAAVIQAAIAIFVVLIVSAGFQGLATTVPALQNTVNIVSLLLLTGLGVAIVLRQLAALQLLPRQVARMAPALTCACCSHHESAHGAAHHHHHRHHHHHHHQQDSHHGLHENHAHEPQRPMVSAMGAMSVTLSMGARPCTSAFAILLLALANDLLIFGIAATLAMALGVALTLAMIAVFSVDLAQHARSALKRWWLPDNAMGVLSLAAGMLLTTLALVGLAQAAAQ